MSENSTTAECRWCGTPLSPSHIGTCPNCVKPFKKVYVRHTEYVKIKDSVDWIGAFLKENPTVRKAIIFTTIAGSLIGFIFGILAGPFAGLGFGFIASLITFWLSSHEKRAVLGKG